MSFLSFEFKTVEGKTFYFILTFFTVNQLHIDRFSYMCMSISRELQTSECL